MKKILLQTIPHTGTHMMHHLFGVLGGIDVIWHHWQAKERELRAIEIAAGMDWEDFVFVRTHRPASEILESMLGRDCIGGEQYFHDCMEVFADNRRRFPRPLIFEIGDKQQMTRAGYELFHRCGKVPPRSAVNFMKTWKKVNSQHDTEDSILGSAAMKDSIHKGRVTTWHTNLISQKASQQ